MSSGCQVLSRAAYRPVGFGASFPPAGTVAVNPYYISNGTEWVFNPAGNPSYTLTQLMTDTAIPAFTVKQAIAFLSPIGPNSLLSTLVQDMTDDTPGNWMVHVYSGGGPWAGMQTTPSFNNPLNSVGTAGGFYNAIVNGTVKVTKAWATSASLSNWYNENVSGPHGLFNQIMPGVIDAAIIAFFTYGIASGALVGGASGTGTITAGTGAGSGGGVGGGAGVGGGSGYTSAEINIAQLQPISTTSISGSIGGGFTPLTQTFSLVGGGGLSGGLLGGGGGGLAVLNQGAGLASVGLKGAALLATLKAQGAQGATGAGPGGAQSAAQLAGTGAASPGKSALPLLIIGGAAAALFAFAHFV